MNKMRLNINKIRQIINYTFEYDKVKTEHYKYDK